jgi:hypothetical protein
VIPFFRRYPLLSEKRSEFEAFAVICEAMMAGDHHTRAGFERLVRLALKMNGDGRYRKWTLEDVVGTRTLRGHTPDTPRYGVVKIWSDPHGDMGT